MSEQQTVVRTRPYAAVMETAALDAPAIHRLAGPSMRMAAVVIADADLRVIYAEGDVLDRDGCRVQDWPGRPWREVLPAELLVEFEPRYRAALEGEPAALEGEPQSFEYWSDDGSAHWAQISAVRGDGGAVVSVVAIIQDITQPEGTDSTERERGSQFAPDVNDALWLERIREAIDEDRLVLYRQPIVDLQTGETVQQELLLRMCGEDGSVVDPADFLPVAERYGLISEIDRWVVGQAVSLAALGQPVEFNLSAASISDPDILVTLAGAIEQTGADPALLVVEVTETAMMIQPAAARLFAERVAALGCRLALDDFGTGYSSLNYLKQIPAQYLKIDIEFVRDLTRSETDERLVRGIIGLAREFKQTTVAEGIEDQATLVRLREFGAHLGQGFFFGGPQPLAGGGPLNAAIEPRSYSTGSDPVGLVRAAFDAFARRNVDALVQMCRPDIVLRDHPTSGRSGRHGPYHGEDGVRAYVQDAAVAWKGLKLTPTAFRLLDRAVFVFGRADAGAVTRTQAIDVLWVWHVRDDLIASVEVFQTPRRDPTPGPRRTSSTSATVSRPTEIKGPRKLELTLGDPQSPERRAKPSRGGGAGTTGRRSRAYGDTLRVGDPHAAAVVIDDALADGLSSVEIQSSVIAPAMWEIGELWERGGLTVAEEHLATAVSHHVLTRLYPGLLHKAQRRGDTIVVAAVHGEHHVLGLRMAADVLEGAGFDVRFLGADLPASSLLAWVTEHRPAAVALGVTMPLGAAALSQELQALHDYDPEMHLIVGGQGVPAVLRERAGVFYASDTRRLLEYVNRAVKTRPPGELPPAIARGGVSFGRLLDAGTGISEGLEARMAQATAAAADAARGQARRAFVLEQIAFRDPLTDLWSRRAFDDRYEDLTAAEITPAPTVLMIDVDHFKSVNDGFGHDAGDHALIGVAGCITRSIRPKDFAARYGGDEFAVLLPDTPAQLAAQIGEHIRSLVASKLTDPSVTVSIGVSVPDHADRRRATLDVDRALYEAKQHGRNQVAVA
jgi:diguanylate cyclase (GGDEF)-like protein